MNPVRDDHATIACALCRRSFVPRGRQRYCDTTCRQSAWRRLHAAPVAPLVIVAKASTVYECDGCGNRYLGTQRCEDCNTFARKIGPGGCCPYCDEPVVLADIIDLDQMRPQAVESTRPNHVSNVSVQPGQPQLVPPLSPRTLGVEARDPHVLKRKSGIGEPAAGPPLEAMALVRHAT